MKLRRSPSSHISPWVLLAVAGTLGALLLADRMGHGRMTTLSDEELCAYEGGQQDPPPSLLNFACFEVSADAPCEGVYGVGCSAGQQGGSCQWCATAPGTTYRKCLPDPGHSCRPGSGSGGADCGEFFTGVCVSGLCHGTGSGASCGSLNHQC